MKSINKKIILSLITLTMCSCAQKENSYKNNETIEIKGTIGTKTIEEDGVEKYNYITFKDYENDGTFASAAMDTESAVMWNRSMRWRRFFLRQMS